MLIIGLTYSWLRKKTGKEFFSNVKFGFVHLSINCLVDNTYQIIFKNVIEF
jgi:hypothetical protein